jgi:cytochrome c oxidase cbb3-type subunit I/II
MAETPNPNEHAFQYDDRIVRSFVGATIVWGLLSTIAGLAIQLLLVVPRASGWFGELSELTSYGRLSPIYTNWLVYAFLGNGIFAGVYYSTQRLCRTRMASDFLNWLHFCCWQLVVLVSAAGLKRGYTQPTVFTEFTWLIDLAHGSIWLSFGVNFFLTLAKRQQRHLFISLWFYMAMVIAVGLLHLCNSFVIPWITRDGRSFAGMEDAFLQSWLGNNFVTCLLVLPSLGIMYYFVPKAANRPIYSHKLAILQFWTFVGFCFFTGTNDLHLTAIPEWISSLAMVFGLMFVMPSLAGFINGWKTLHGGDDARTEIGGDVTFVVLKYFTLALLFYGVSVIETGLTSIKHLQALVNYTQWPIARFYTSGLGWCGFLVLGMIYWLMPRLNSSGIWSVRLAKSHFGVGVLGLLLTLIPGYFSGAAQAFSWHAMDATGNLRYPEFSQSFSLLQWSWWVSIVGQGFYFLGLIMLAINYIASGKSSQPINSSNAQQLAPAQTVSKQEGNLVEDPLPPPSRLVDAPVLELGRKFEQWTHLYWHRRWERLPGRMTSLIVIGFGVGIFVILAPQWLGGNNATPIASVRDYTPLERYGRQLYVSEGCCNCHTQMVRILVSETKRLGEFSRAGEFIYDRPAQWGRVRIGPDLARQGGRNSSYWHWTHFQNPQEVSPGSVMPDYQHLVQQKIPWEKIAEEGVKQEQAIAQAKSQAEFVAAEIVKQGGPPVYEGSMVLDTQIVALIAYLQRLGTDLNRPQPSKSGAHSNGTSASAEKPSGKEG